MAIFDGRKLRAIRKYQDLTAAELAERADICTSIVYSYESGKITPRMQTMELLAAALGVPVVALLTDEARGDVNGGRGSNGQRGNHEGAGRYKDDVAGATETGAPGDSFAGCEVGNSGGIYEDKRDRAQAAGEAGRSRDCCVEGYRREQSLQVGIDRLDRDGGGVVVDVSSHGSNIKMSKEQRRALKDKLLEFALSINGVQDAQRRAICLDAARLLLREF